MAVKFDTMNAREASEILKSYGLRISADSIRMGIRIKQFPFGYWIPKADLEHTANCTIFRNKLMEWIYDNAGRD